MHGFLGRHEYQIDDKGRVSFPSPFRRVVSGGPLVLVRWQSDHLVLFPIETWTEEIEKNLKAHRKATRDGGRYLRHITSNAVNVEPDSHGRIRIPPPQREHIGLDATVLFIGAIDRIELWNPSTFDEQLAQDLGDDEFAAQIFG